MSETRAARPIRVLYVVYWGAAEPLGQSLVVPALLKLATMGAELTVVTFEKPTDLARRDEMARIRSSFQRARVQWIPLQYHKRPKVPATAYDILHGSLRGVLSRLRHRPDVVHARTFIGGVIGLALAPLLGAKLIYHNEGFYPDEQVDGGVWLRGSKPHRVAKRLERAMYERADGIITLSHRAERVVRELPPVAARGTPTTLVPSCVDLDRFRRDPSPKDAAREVLRLVYIGSIGGRYIFDRVARFVAAAHRELGDLRLRVLTGTEPAAVETMLREGGVPEGAWSIACVPHESMPGELAEQHTGIFFLARGISEHGCSPTKIGEYWAMGLPVVTTPNVSDTDDIIARHRVGVIVADHTEAEYRRAARELRLLLEDNDLRARCRRAAEEHYALVPACERQMALYREVMSRTAGTGQYAGPSKVGSI